MQQMVQNRLKKLIDNIAKDFSVDKLSKSSARFNLEKLNWFNREYIKMMSLKEFAYRANYSFLHKKYPHLTNLRIGSYVYLVDFERQIIYTENEFGVLGGGVESGESAEEAAIREVYEESNEQLHIKAKNLIFLDHFYTDRISNFEEFDGKDITLYVHKTSQNQLKPWTALDEYFTKQQGKDIYNTYKWVELEKFIEQNPYISYPLWQNFCEQNGLACCRPSELVLTQYLAWHLDKNRVTVLSELGSESDCILNWQKPAIEDLKWKKITLEESLTNLQAITEIVTDLYSSTQLTKLQENLKQELLLEIATGNSNYQKCYQEVVMWWENQLKAWLSQNDLDTGSHLWPLRVSLSGKLKSPSPFEILAILSLDQAVSRLTESKK